jgi:5'-nucleotidase
MRLLITNDDGIDSVFLHELIRALRAAGHALAVVAPKHEQSWIGAAKSRHRGVHAAPADRDFGCPTWIVDGTPSDCINIALGHLLPGGASGPAANFAPDAVISGINVGFNASLGFILASGTIAGAWEGALHGLPGVAFSQELTPEAWDRLKANGDIPDPGLLALLKISAQRAAHLVPGFVAATAPRSFVVHNVNFPFGCRPDAELRRTVPARVIVPGLFGPADKNGQHRLIFKRGDDLSPANPLTDRAALAAGMISHTVLDYGKLGR